MNLAEHEKLHIGAMVGDWVLRYAMLAVFGSTNIEKCAKHVIVLLKKMKKVVYIVQNVLISFKFSENYRFKSQIYLINLSINLRWKSLRVVSFINLFSGFSSKPLA